MTCGGDISWGGPVVAMLTNMAVIGSETMSNIKLLAVASVFVLVLTVALVALRETQFGGGSRVALAACVAALATIGVYQYVDFILVVYAAVALALLGLFSFRFYLRMRGFWRSKQASPPPQSAKMSPPVLADDVQPPSAGTHETRLPDKSPSKVGAPGTTQTRHPVWPCYIVIDCSKWTADLTPQIKRGVTRFVAHMQAQAGSGIEPALAVVECCGSNNKPPIPQPLGLLSLPDLRCEGDSAVASIFQPLLECVREHARNGDRKALVVFLLSGPLGEGSNNLAEILKGSVLQGQANIVGIGASNSVNDAALRNLANIPLRITEAHDGVSIEKCFEWLADVASQMVMSGSQGGVAGTLKVPALPNGIRFAG